MCGGLGTASAAGLYLVSYLRQSLVCHHMPGYYAGNLLFLPLMELQIHTTVASFRWVPGIWAQVFKLPWQVLCTRWAISSALGNIFSILTFLVNKSETQEQCRRCKVAKTSKQANRHTSFVRTCQGIIARHRQRWPTRQEFSPCFCSPCSSAQGGLMSQGKPPLIQHNHKPVGDSWTSIRGSFPTI